MSRRTHGSSCPACRSSSSARRSLPLARKMIRRLPYRAGDRSAASRGVRASSGEIVADITVHQSMTHWPKALDVADDGTIYVSNGGDQGEVCDPEHPIRGGIFVLDGSPGARHIVKGMRNPIALRCHRGKNQCFAAELSRDYSASMGGREKLVPIREGDDWGFPCCATKDVPYPDVAPTPDCSRVAPEGNSFVIGDTPFGFDFAPDTWPGRWAGSVILTLHGAFGSWAGAKIVAIATDPATGKPLPSPIASESANSSLLTSFAVGWDDGTKAHGRPADASFAPDGRLFIADDVRGEIFWIAPATDGGSSHGSQRDASSGGGGSAGRGGFHDAGSACRGELVWLAADVQPIFDGYCTSCHGPPTPSEQLDLTARASWSSTVRASSRQCGGLSINTPGDLGQSYLWSKLQGQRLCSGSAPMPPRGLTLPLPEMEVVRSWICMGAPNN